MQELRPGASRTGNMKIGTKLFIFSLTAAALIVAVWLLSSLCANKVSIGSELYNELQLSNELRADILPPPEYILESYATALEYITISDQAKRDELLGRMSDLKAMYKERSKYWQVNLPKENKVQKAFLSDSYSTAFQFYASFEQQTVPAVKSGNPVLIESARKALTAAYEQHRTAIDATVKYAENWYQRSLNEAEAMRDQNDWVMIMIVAASLFLSLLASIIIPRSIIRHLKYVAGINSRIAQGELALKVDPRQITGDEIGQLCRTTADILARLNSYAAYIQEVTLGLGTMAHGDMRIHLKHDYAGEFAPIKAGLLGISSSLSRTLSVINASAGQVSAGAAQVSAGAQALAAGSSEQASSVEELNVSLSKVAGQAMENSANVKTATDYVGQAADGVNRSNEHMDQLTQAMSEIGSASSQITNITKAIEDIAFQTNILALNATIEAARAGSAGKGFAVVAEEVRNLAAKSAEAAKQTAELIQASVLTVSKGANITSKTAQILHDVGEKAQMVIASIDKVDRGSTEQAAALAQIKQGLAQVSTIVQTNAATAEENSATSEQMSAQAATLRREVEKFKLDNGSEKESAAAVSLVGGRPVTKHQAASASSAL